MLSRFLPEGRRLETPENRAACSSLSGLLSARDRDQILEGMALSCSPEHDLTVALGPFIGVIPRLETAVGVAEGTVRDIAILSRVGKPVCFLVEGVMEGPEGPRLLLSRRRAQLWPGRPSWPGCDQAWSSPAPSPIWSPSAPSWTWAAAWCP